MIKPELESSRRQYGLQVPVKADLGVGKNWRMVHP
jgi:DNA polymerase I-like protein with 3'-5' exonuclease and polymerase domains